MPKHSPEPWRWEKTGPIDAHIVAADGTMVVGGEESEGYVDENDPNVRRIIACVNACAGIETSTLEQLTAEFRRYGSCLPPAKLLAAKKARQIAMRILEQAESERQPPQEPGDEDQPT